MPDDFVVDGLFEVDPAQRVEADFGAAKPPVDKTFRTFDPDQGLLLPPSLDDWLPAEHLARFIAELVDEHLDLSRIHAAYTEELRRRETRLAKIRGAKAALEEEAGQLAHERAQQRAKDAGDDDDTAAQKGAAAAEQATPKPKAQRNFTDPDSKIMLTGDGAFHQCYNAQAVVDEDHQVILATEIGTNAADVGTLMPMTEQAAANTGQVPDQVLTDAGYCPADNLDRAAAYTAEHGTEFFSATGRRRRDDPPPVAPRGPIPKDATSKQRMARKLAKAQHSYARRKAIVEPVFGQMSTLQNAKHLLLRGLEQARGEWQLLAACRNLRKLHRHIGVSGLAALATS